MKRGAVKVLVDRYDKNGDRVFTFDEFIEMMEDLEDQDDEDGSDRDIADILRNIKAPKESYQREAREAMEQRQRQNITEQTRGRVGRIEAGAARGGLSVGPGTSSFAGATGAIQSSATANLENINLASGASTAISQGNQRAADYATKANVAYGEQQSGSSLSSLGGNMFKYSDKDADAGNALFSIFKT